MLQEIFIAAAAGGNANNALSQMGFEHLIHEMTSQPGDFAVSWVVLHHPGGDVGHVVVLDRHQHLPFGPSEGRC